MNCTKLKCLFEKAGNLDKDKHSSLLQFINHRQKSLGPGPSCNYKTLPKKLDKDEHSSLFIQWHVL